MKSHAPLPSAADLKRSRGHRGGVIPMHRALAHFRLGPLNLVIAVTLFLFFSYLWLLVLPRVCAFWNYVLRLGLHFLPLQAELGLAAHHITKAFQFKIPYLRLEPVMPGPDVWWLTFLATVLLFAATYLCSQRWIPVVYLFRGALLVHGTALFYFAVRSAHFPHTPDSYMQGLMTSEIGLISIVPALYGLIYYIFDFGLFRKALLTALTMIHLAVFLPFQVLLQALILQKTVLFMPVLYIVFGLPMNVMLIIAFYSWGMAWPFRKA